MNRESRSIDISAAGAATTLYTEFDVDPEHVSIKACSLDDPTRLAPDRHLFIIRKQPWLGLADNLTRYERDC